MKKFITAFFSFLVLSSMVLMPNVALGQPKSVQGGLDEIKGAFPQTKVDDSNPQGTLKSIIEWALYIAGILSVIFIIIGGYMYLTARGNDSQVGSARKTIVNALIGLVVTVLAYVIVQTVYRFIAS